MLKAVDTDTGVSNALTKGPPRPPGTLREAKLKEVCTGCGDCITVCPSAALSLDPEGHPVLSAKGRCGQCGLCADVCMQGAIELTARTRAGLQFILAVERGTDTRSA